MNYDLLPKTFIVALLVIAAGSFGTGAYFSQKHQELSVRVAPQTAAAVTVTEKVQAAPAPVSQEIAAQALVAEIPDPTPSPTPVQSSVSASGQITYSPFERNLTVGSVGADVKILQTLLNETDYPIAASGPGSKGKETTKFGPSTAKALAQLQCDRGLVCEGTPDTTGYGAVNDETREILNALYNLTRPKDYSKRTIRIKK